MNRMLINATQAEEIRVALVNGQALYDLDLENMEKELLKGNLYLATIKNVEPSLNAAFVDYGAERHGFLPLKEISKEYFESEEDANIDESRGSRKNIRDILRVGQQILVQVDKDERGSKGAALTTFITLAGCYLVLMPNNPRAGGISRRIEGEERDELRDALEGLEVPNGMGIIVRTAGVGRSPEELKWDLDVLLKRWEDIQNAIATVTAPALIHQERDIIARAIRDHLRDDVEEILIDNPVYFEKARHYIERLRPESIGRLKLYTDIVPLFSRFQIENQIESAFQRQVVLPSGGTLVIDHTEALISIDINSARATRGHDIEETAFHTNLEAADEIARQLRLRDLGGLIVIDFIDMLSNGHQRDVENRLREAMRLDRARVQIGRISRFGLLEMSRQRLRSSLSESVQETCPRCSGQGTIRNIESLSLSIIRLIEEEVMKDGTVAVHAALPIDVATFLMNEKRNMLSALEARHGKKVVVMPVVEIQAPNFQIKRIRENDSAAMGETSSFEMARDMVTRAIEQNTVAASRHAPQTPVVQFLSDVKPREQSLIQKSVSGISQLFKSVFKQSNEKDAEPNGNVDTSSRSGSSRNYQGDNRERNERGDRGGRGRYGKRRDNRPRSDQPRADQPRSDQPRSEAPRQHGDNPAPRGDRADSGHDAGRESGREGGREGGGRGRGGRGRGPRQDNRGPRDENRAPRDENRAPRDDNRVARDESRVPDDVDNRSRRGIGEDTRRRDGRRAPEPAPYAEPTFSDMPEALLPPDMEMMDMQPADIDHRSPMERTGEPRGGRGRRGGHQRNRRGGQDRERAQGDREHHPSEPRFVKHETPAPIPMVDTVREEAHVPAAATPDIVIVQTPPPAPRAPRERKVPKVDSPLMKETVLMDVTAMNAADAAAKASSEPSANEGHDRRYPRRRANHLRPYHRGESEAQTPSPSSVPSDNEGNG